MEGRETAAQAPPPQEQTPNPGYPTQQPCDLAVGGVPWEVPGAHPRLLVWD